MVVTSRGVTVLDPEALRADDGHVSDDPRIEGVTADEQRYGAVPGATLPPRIDRLRIDYTLVNLSSVERTASATASTGSTGTGSTARSAPGLLHEPAPWRLSLPTAGIDQRRNLERRRSHLDVLNPADVLPDGVVLCVVRLALVLSGVGAWRLRVRHVRKELALVFGERLRVSREIHDTLLQSLFGIALRVDVAADDVRDQSLPLRTHLQQIRRQIEDAMSEARQSIFNLRSGTLDRSDLVTALRETGDRLTAGRVPFVLKVTGTPRSCPSEVQAQVLRIGHEAIANAVRHADAGRVNMEIGFGEGTLILRVTDDGRGFRPEIELAPDHTGHYGLIGMRERAIGAGGRCTIHSSPGAGVQVAAEFPLSSTGHGRKVG